MKRCPECRRDYHDDTLSFCLADGSELVYGLAEDEPATAFLGRPGEPPSRRSVADAKTELFENRQTRDDPNAETLDSLSGQPAGDGFAKGAGAFDKRLLLAPVALAVIVLAGFYAYRYFSATTSGSINSIAVLPFENRSGGTDTDYLSDGLTDSLIFRFSQLPNVKVSPTSSVMRYKGKEADVADIARELDVDAVMSGRLTQMGESLSISVQLIDARSKKLIWAEQYDRKMADLLATQREIATTLTQKMQLKLAGDERGITKKYTNSSEAYQLYLKGRYHWSRRTKEDLKKAIESYKAAIALDPNFALAYAGIAEAYNSLGKNPHLAPKESIPLAKDAAAKALEIDPSLPQAHSAMGDALAIYDWEWARSEEHFKKAIELDPNISYTQLVYGASLLTPLGRAEDALKQGRRAVELEPLSLINNAVVVSAYLHARQPERALAQARATFELDPSFVFSRHWLGFALIANGKSEEAIQLCASTATSDPSGAWLSTVVLAHAYATMGNRAEAEAQINKLRDAGRTQYIRSYYLALIYAALGDKDKAFVELERSYEDHDCYLGRAAVDPFLDPLRGDPRFRALLKRMNLPG